MQQKPQDAFVLDFISAFRATDWTQFSHGDDWPHSYTMLLGTGFITHPPQDRRQRQSVGISLAGMNTARRT
jgi:hypothetical protein